MFTLRVIFVGLIAMLSNNPEPGATAVLMRTENPVHEARALLLEGRCTSGDACLLERLEGYGEADFRPDLQWRLDDLSLSLEGFGSLSLSTTAGRPATPLGAAEMPGDETEIADWSWMPSLQSIVGDLEPRASCFAGAPQDCPIQARFLVDAGSLSACHLAHDLVMRFGNHRRGLLPDSASECRELTERSTTVGPERVRIYRMPDGSRQSIADAIVVEHRIQASEIQLSAWFNKDWPPDPDKNVAPERTVTLQPVDGAVTLVVLNTPVYRKTKSSIRQLVVDWGAELDTGGDPKIPVDALFAKDVLAPLEALSTRDHFSRFYELFEHCNVCGGVPKLEDGDTIVPPGLCEPYLECLESLLLWEPASALFHAAAEDDVPIQFSVPHNLSRCDTPTYP